MKRQTGTVKDIFKDEWNEGDRDLWNHRPKIKDGCPKYDN